MHDSNFLGIDHALILVSNINMAGSAFKRIGFRLHSQGDHIGRGTANIAIVFANSYCELLSVSSPTPFNVLHRRLLTKGEGFWGLGLSPIPDRSVHSALKKSGIQVLDIRRIERTVRNSDPAMIAAFDVFQLPSENVVEGMIFVCKHITPELVWRAGRLPHPNEVSELKGVTYISQHPSHDAVCFAKLLGQDIENCTIANDSVHVGNNYVRFLTTASFEHAFGIAAPRRCLTPYPAAISLLSRDLCATKSWFKENNVSYVGVDDNMLTLSADIANGAVLSIEGNRTTESSDELMSRSR